MTMQTKCAICGKEMRYGYRAPPGITPVCTACAVDLACEECGASDNLHYREWCGHVLCNECAKIARKEQIDLTIGGSKKWETQPGATSA